MMGLLFQDFIPGDKYSYWASGDYDGFFGSFNQLLDFKKLYHYDVISGISKPIPDNIKLLKGNNAEVKRIEPTRVTGAFMIHRNIPKVYIILILMVYSYSYSYSYIDDFLLASHRFYN